MRIVLTERQKQILRILRAKDGGKNAALFDGLEMGRTMAIAEIDALCGLINAEFMMEGILPTFEPNEYGIELEGLLDVVNRPRLSF
ncbi:hypothetical protein [Pandoraea commovens]|uniref:Uncharacterized protein n=1 Tax=Pandoraea commovens TaxID=2508289 RepID=A0A5E4YHH5_9BURK|nr:hypothetical protein [Pandoraea commovens]VVE48174.1 hypothetical protein PCO31010_04539 [Pandoraea commovens]